MKLNLSLLSLFLLYAVSCGPPEQELGSAPVPGNYEEQVHTWYDERVESLKEPAGWLRLAGMYVLEEGENHFGSGSEQEIQFPEGTMPDHAGSFILDNGRVEMKAAEGVELIHEGEPVREMTIFDGENAPAIQYGPLEWVVIQRQELIAIRLYNKDNEKADRFDGFPRYPVDADWHLKALFEPHPDSTTIRVTNVLGQTDDVISPGTLRFEADGSQYTLDALESSSGRLFMIVGDQTNRSDTYQAGRYIYVDPPGKDGYTIIDFNKIYNPPCAYTPYSTCQLPPPQNRLSLAIPAGEKRPADWEGF